MNIPPFAGIRALAAAALAFTLLHPSPCGADSPDPFGAPVREIDGWKESPWFGWYQDPFYPYVHHVEHGWTYVAAEGDWATWWDYRTQEWFTTSGNGIYPFIYRFATEQWLWYYRGSINPRWFVDAAAFNLPQVPDTLYLTELPGRLLTLAQRFPRIAAAYPDAGPPDTPVYLRFGDSLEPLGGDLAVLFGETPAPIDRISGELLVTRVPAGAAGAGFSVRVAGQETDFQPFAVTAPSATPLLSRSLSPAAAAQVVDHAGEIEVELPGGFLDRARTLSIARIDHPPASALPPGVAPRVYDVKLEGLSQLPGHLTVRVPYDPADLDPTLPPEWQAFALRWDEADQVWYQLPYTIDTERRFVEAHTDHLSLIGLGLLTVAAGLTSAVGEYVLNDAYRTPLGNFQFLYSRSAMDADPVFGSGWSRWRPVGIPRPVGFPAVYDSAYPEYIQDLGLVFEAALSNYLHAEFRNPVHEGRLWGNYPVVVKIDSWWSRVTGLGISDPQYEKIWQNLHLPTVELQSFTGARSSLAVIGHELFHRVQAEYYSRLQFRQSAHFWWLEATAEYAGSRAAFPNQPLESFRQAMRPGFLRHPLTTTGMPDESWKMDYEYAASAFLEFLVEVEGSSFRELVEHVAGGVPLERLNSWCLNQYGRTLGETYARFAAWGALSESGFLARYPLATFAGGAPAAGELADARDTLELTGAVGLKVAVTGGSASRVDIYVLDAGERAAGGQPPLPMAQLLPGEDIELAGLRNNDVLCLLATNSAAAGTSVGISLEKVLSDGTRQEVLSRTSAVAGPLASHLWAVKLTLDEVSTSIGLADCQRDYLNNALRLRISGEGQVVTDGITTTTVMGDCFDKTLYINRKKKAGPPARIDFPYTVEVEINEEKIGWKPAWLVHSWKASAGNPYLYRIITIGNPRTVVTHITNGWSRSESSLGQVQFSAVPAPGGTSFNYRVTLEFDWSVDWYNTDKEVELTESGTSSTPLFSAQGSYADPWW